jgi:hypothetical protein
MKYFMGYKFFKFNYIGKGKVEIQGEGCYYTNADVSIEEIRGVAREIINDTSAEIFIPVYEEISRRCYQLLTTKNGKS